MRTRDCTVLTREDEDTTANRKVGIVQPHYTTHCPERTVPAPSPQLELEMLRDIYHLFSSAAAAAAAAAAIKTRKF